MSVEVVSLKLDAGYRNGFSDANDLIAIAHLEKLNKVYQALLDGRLYVKYLEGDRAGSIGKVSHNPRYNEPKAPSIYQKSYDYYTKQVKYDFKNYRFYVEVTWKGRRNKIQDAFPDFYVDTEFLIGDDIETVWNVFDSKAAKKALLENPNQKDIDGNVLTVGDKVMYINLAYGSRAVLMRGTITEFKASVDSKSHKITTVIMSDCGVKSELNYPENMVHKQFT
jgi:uncharacterized Zn ribbon protein